MGVVVGVELAAGLGAVVAAWLGLVLGLGDDEWLRAGRARFVNGQLGEVLLWARGLACLTWCAVAGDCWETGVPAIPMPTRPVSVPAATLVVARTIVVRRCLPP